MLSYKMDFSFCAWKPAGFCQIQSHLLVSIKTIPTLRVCDDELYSSIKYVIIKKKIIVISVYLYIQSLNEDSKLVTICMLKFGGLGIWLHFAQGQIK